MTSDLTFQTELAKFSLANRASRESLSASDDVFHYTSADAFKEILSRGQIWLTNTAYLNDRNELRYPVELCQQIVQDKRDSYRLTLASLAQGGPPERSLLDRIHKEITLHEMFKPWYTASFSLEPNRLSQWRAYCGNGGYAIGFNTDKLAANLNERYGHLRDLISGKIDYAEQIQRERLGAVLDRCLQLLKHLVETYPENEAEVHEEWVQRVVWMLGEEMLLCKMNSFKEEREWRLAFHAAQAEKDVEFTARDGRLVPYVKIDLRDSDGRLPLSSVWIGPLGDQPLLSHATSLFILTSGYDIPIHMAGYEIL